MSRAEVKSLYVHIPFCERKCEYCDFTSLAGLRSSDEYVVALQQELEFLAPAASELDTIFFGGGTPGLLEPSLITQLMETIKQNYSLAGGCEVTIEANPSSVSADRVSRWREAGFNRVSLGVQSLDNNVLKFLGRVHDSGQAVAAAGLISGTFDNFSCDLIYAVPQLTRQTWLSTLEGVAALKPQHISAYELTFEPGTPLYASLRRGAVKAVDDDAAIEQHWMAVDFFSSIGYSQYEISNFARDGRECRHNLAYWHNAYYVSAGLGAHGHLDAVVAQSVGMEAAAGTTVRYWNTRKLRRYLQGTYRDNYEVVSDMQRERERLLVGLRLNEGVVLDDESATRAMPLQQAGLLTLNDDRACLTRRGQEVLNEVVARLAA